MLLKKRSLSLIGKSGCRITRIEISAFTAALLYYFFSSFLPSDSPLLSLLDPGKISSIECRCVSNPEKRENTYVIHAECIKVFYEKDSVTFCSSSSGSVILYIPCDVIESQYPGRLYSKTGNESCFEKGSILYCLTSPVLSGSTLTGFRVHSALQTGWSSKFAYYRSLLRMNFRRLMYVWGDSGALLLALLSGSRDYLGKSIREGFKNAGISHILALSGSHLSVLASLTTYVSKKTAGKKSASVFSFVSIVLFVWFAGFSPSLLRAFICSCIFFVCSIFSIKPGILKVLACCFLLQICISPADGTCISFLLSYAALAGIASAGKISYSKMAPYIPPVINSSLSASIGAQLFTAPLTLLFFGTITPGGIIATVIISPLISLFMICGLISILLSLCLPCFTDMYSFAMGGLYEIINFLVLLFSKIPSIPL